MTAPVRLTTEQRDAAYCPAHSLLLVAIAGSGKTTVLIERIVWYLQTGTAPESLLLISFTRPAVESLRTRVAARVGQALASRLTCLTFHALGLMLCRKEAAALHLPATVRVLNDAEAEPLAAPLVTPPFATAADVLTHLERIRQPHATLTPADRTLLQQWQAILHQAHALDFTELLRRPIGLFHQHPARRTSWQHRFSTILVDEYQDVSPLETELLRLLVDPGRTRLTVVGDDDQCLYGFRHSNHALLTVERDFPGTQRRYLTQNFRSTPAILSAATRLIRNNQTRFDKDPRTTRDPRTPVTLCAAHSYGPASVAWIRATHQVTQDLAILARTNRLLDAIRPVLKQAGFGSVPLMTIHGAKGLEWDHVALIGVDAGVLPHVHSTDIEEERRLLYVAMTRARHDLTLFYHPGRPSPFLTELDARTGWFARWFKNPPADLAYRAAS